MGRQGRTRQSCDGCHRKGYEQSFGGDHDLAKYYGRDRAADSLCDECLATLERAKKLIEREKQASELRANLKSYRVNHEMPYARHVDYEFRGPVLTRLHALAFALGVEPVLPSDRDSNAPRIFTRPTNSGGYGTDYYAKHVLISPEHAELLDSLEHAMQAQIDCAYEGGFREGRNLLKALADGQMTTTQFDDAHVRKAKA